MPVACRRCTPRPATRGLGSSVATTTLPTPAAIRASQQGGVRPWWEQGSRITYTVAPRTDSPSGLRIAQGHHLGVRPPGVLGVAFTDDAVAGPNDDAADGGAGVGEMEGFLRHLLGRPERMWRMRRLVVRAWRETGHQQPLSPVLHERMRPAWL